MLEWFHILLFGKKGLQEIGSLNASALASSVGEVDVASTNMSDSDQPTSALILSAVLLLFTKRLLNLNGLSHVVAVVRFASLFCNSLA
jgi:hypothetical protein